MESLPFLPVLFNIELLGPGSYGDIRCRDYRDCAPKLLELAGRDSQMQQFVATYSSPIGQLDLQRLIDSRFADLLASIESAGGLPAATPKLNVQTASGPSLHFSITCDRKAMAAATAQRLYGPGSCSWDLDGLDEFWATGRLSMAYVEAS